MALTLEDPRLRDVLAGVAGGPNATVPRGAAPGVAYVTTDAPRAVDKPYIVRDGPDFFLIKPKPRLATTGCCASEVERIPFQNVYVARPERPEDVREKLSAMVKQDESLQLLSTNSTARPSPRCVDGFCVRTLPTACCLCDGPRGLLRVPCVLC